MRSITGSPAARPMPVAFFGHGSPTNTLARNCYTEAWRTYAAAVPAPRAILVVSAHWYVPGVRLTASVEPPTIRDFNARFDESLFAFEYRAQGSEEVVERVAALLEPERVERDFTWGIDHGAYSVLAHLYPAANVPVVQLSIDRTKSPREHYRLARQLAPLRREGIFIVGSGNVVHNLELARFQPRLQPFTWALRHEERIRTLTLEGDDERLVEYRTDGDDAKLSIPTPEHYLPLLYVVAQRQSGDVCATFAAGVEAGSLSMLSLSLSS